MNSDQFPDVISHYTDLSGFRGIVENKEFWMSNVSFLNDREELSHGLSAAKAIVNEIQKRTLQSDMRKGLLTNIAKGMAGRNPPDTYVACFCEKPDLLSQWRGYGSVQGVAIHFDAESLRDSFTNKNVALEEVIYGNIETKNQIKKAINDTVPEIQDEMDWLLGNTDKDVEDSFFKLLSKLAPKFKHAGFEEECEWRLVWQDPDPSLVEFRVKAGVMLPYVRLRAPQSLPIRSITVGPGDEEGKVLASVQFYLKTKGYKKVEVHKSNTPYRT